MYAEVADLNKKRRLVHENVSLTLMCADIISIALSLFLAKQTLLTLKQIYGPENFTEPLINYIYMHDLVFVVLSPFVIFYFFIKGHYTQRIPWWSQVQSILRACAVTFVFDGFLRFAMDVSVSRLMIGLSWIYLFFTILALRQIAHYFLRKQNIWEMEAVVIADIDTAVNLLFAVHNDRYTGYNVKTVLLRDHQRKVFDLSELPAAYADLAIIRDTIDYKSYFMANLDKFFIISLETFRSSEREDVINALTSAKALYAVMPPTWRMNSYEMEPRYFFGNDIILMHAKQKIFSPMGRILKRAMDIVISFCALALLSPVFLIVALCLKIEGQGGSIFYGGKRIGRYGQRFNCWKFRSMEPNSDHLLHELLERDPQAKADWETYRKLKQPDPRITTRTASIIRKTSIDELPQIWNVMIGDMSLVGPRPILEDEAQLFGDTLNHYLRVRPGITGLWQVSGRNDTSFQRRVYWDGWYVRNWSLWGDIVILFKTLSVVFGRRGAF